jgi:hypothetical protein
MLVPSPTQILPDKLIIFQLVLKCSTFLRNQNLYYTVPVDSSLICGEASYTPCRTTAAVRPVDLHAVEILQWKQKDSESNGGKHFLNFNSGLLLKWQLNIVDPSKTKIYLFF